MSTAELVACILPQIHDAAAKQAKAFEHKLLREDLTEDELGAGFMLLKIAASTNNMLCAGCQKTQDREERDA